MDVTMFKEDGNIMADPLPLLSSGPEDPSTGQAGCCNAN